MRRAPPSPTGTFARAYSGKGLPHYGATTADRIRARPRANPNGLLYTPQLDIPMPAGPGPLGFHRIFGTSAAGLVFRENHLSPKPPSASRL
jgi:hypothetical protein